MPDWMSLWYQKQQTPPLGLRCAAGVYQFFSQWHAQRLQKQAYHPQLLTIVVGNLTLGGTGKSPVVQTLVRACQQQGLTPCVLSRGYKAAVFRHGKTALLPRKRCTVKVKATDCAHQVGDEPLMLHLATGASVWINPDRVQAAKEAERSGDFDLLILDDGLQHWSIRGHVQLCVVDAVLGFGNGYLLPAGPLREPLARLNSLDALLINGPKANILDMPITQNMADAFAANTDNFPQYAFSLTPQKIRHSASGQCYPVDYFRGKPVQAMVGIGHPERFLSTLESLGMKVTSVFKGKDHHSYTRSDLNALDSKLPILTTAKDWVKLKALTDSPNLYIVEVTAQLPQTFWEQQFFRWLKVQESDYGQRSNE